jgi:hypothetical protein
MPTGPDSSSHLANVGKAIRGVGQKVEDGAIMPHVKRGRIKSCGKYVCFTPNHFAGCVTEAAFRLGKRGVRQVEKRHVDVAGGDQAVHQR